MLLGIGNHSVFNSKTRNIPLVFNILTLFAHEYFIYNYSLICFQFYSRMIRKLFRKSSLLKQNNFLFSTKTVGDIEFHQHDSFMKVLLNRPKALNSLNLDMIRVINAEIPALNQNKAVWFEGAGGKAFCAGGDVKSLFDKGSSVQDRLTFFREEFTTDYHITQLKSLQIANWDGIVMGGGFGITSMAPFVIASENSMFAMPEAKLGFFTDVSSSYILSRLRNNIGFYLGLTGARLKGEDLYISGLANYFIPRKNIEQAYNEIKTALPTSSRPKETISSILQKHHQPSGRKTLANEQQIKDLFGLSSFIDIYKKASSGSDEFSVTITKQLNQQCPISVGVVHRLISTAKGMSFRDCFLRDFKLCQHFIVDNNFAEGVRTVLVERGSTPNWSHKHILDVKSQDVDKYFQFPANFEELKI